MTPKVRAKAILVILGLFVQFPIYYYLWYKVLRAVHATELMMFLFWVYVPLSIVVFIIAKIVED
jgi:hypothetical protein